MLWRKLEEHLEFDANHEKCQPQVSFRTWKLPTPGSAGTPGWHGCTNRQAPAGSFVLILKAGKNKHKKPMKDQKLIMLDVEELEERIAPGGFGPSNNGNPGNEVSNGARPQPSGHPGGHGN